MLRAIRDRPAPVLLVGILFGLLILMSVQVTGPEGSTLLETGLFRITAPVVRIVSGTVAAMGSLWESYIDLRGVRQENLQLTDEIRALRLERSRFEAVMQENAHLRELIDLQERVEIPSVVAQILANQSLGAQRTLVIDRGERDGLSVNHPVVAPLGVVGRVVAVGFSTAKVQLITDAGSGTAVRLARTRLQGLAAGRGGETLRLQWIPQLEDVRPGDRLVTSGLDRIYPAGYPIGHVLRIAEGSGPMKEIEVSPAVDAARLEHVLVLLVHPAARPGPDLRQER